MLSKVNQCKRYMGARFGYGERLPLGTYAVPTLTGHGPAFMRLILGDDGDMSGFDTYWDEELTINTASPKPFEPKAETPFAAAFRALEAAR